MSLRVLFLLFLCFPAMAQRFTPENNVEFGELQDRQQALCSVASATNQYLQRHADDSFAVHAGQVFSGQVTLARVKATLAFICEVVQQDMVQHRASRLQDPLFLRRHFEFLRWQPDKDMAESLAVQSDNKRKQQLLRAIPDDQIMLTKYYTKLLDASARRSEHYSQALYALPYDEQGLSQQQALQRKGHLTRFRYTRQQVMQGILLQQHLAKPLVWLTEEGLHDVLLQGTGVLNVDGKIHYYNVHRNNGIDYDYSKGKRDQARYWYFAEVPSIMGYGNTLASKITVQPQVTLAGNVEQLGLGKLLMLSYVEAGKQVSRMAVLADQGGAFDHNLFQLDLLVDSYRGWDDYHQANKQLPDYAKAWIMLLKQ